MWYSEQHERTNSPPRGVSDLLLRLLLLAAGGLRQLHPHVLDWNTQDLALLFAEGYLRADDIQKEEKNVKEG